MKSKKQQVYSAWKAEKDGKKFSVREYAKELAERFGGNELTFEFYLHSFKKGEAAGQGRGRNQSWHKDLDWPLHRCRINSVKWPDLTGQDVMLRRGQA